mmetsp:Transcript_54493/g.133212  ORF Transcript_54493/g.133212 Transcript_54493/m.133212 type:complete len:317 (+) Transcript_54493:181-1131(+)
MRVKSGALAEAELSEGEPAGTVHEKPVGIMTVSMTWTTPLLARLSALVIIEVPEWVSVLAAEYVKVLAVPVARVGMPAVVLTTRSVDMTVPSTTWYLRRLASRSLLAEFLRQLTVSTGILAKAALVGAKTVKAVSTALVCRVVTRPARPRSSVRVEKSVDAAMSTTVRCVEGGRSTASTTWTTPLVAKLSAAVTVASPWAGVTVPAALTPVTWGAADFTETFQYASILPATVSTWVAVAGRAAALVSLERTWYLRVSARRGLHFSRLVPVEVSLLTRVEVPSAVKAASVGAKRVKGPVPPSVAASSALPTRVSSMV